MYGSPLCDLSGCLSFWKPWSILYTAKASRGRSVRQKQWEAQSGTPVLECVQFSAAHNFSPGMSFICAWNKFHNHVQEIGLRQQGGCSAEFGGSSLCILFAAADVSERHEFANLPWRTPLSRRKDSCSWSPQCDCSQYDLAGGLFAWTPSGIHYTAMALKDQTLRCMQQMKTTGLLILKQVNS